MSPRLLGRLLAPLALATALAQAQALAIGPAVAQAQARHERPVVLVVDPGRARVSGERLLRAIASVTSRLVVRITDERARDPEGTLTIAYAGTATWLVRYDSRGRSAFVHERVARPGLLDASLAAAAVRVIAAAERESEPAAERSSARIAHDRVVSVAWADELLDPFAGFPPPRRETALLREVIDPFAPAAARRDAWPEVIDPWSL